VTVILDPEVRLRHLGNYLETFHIYLTFEEAQVQLLRIRLIGYKLVAEQKDGKYDKDYVDDIVRKAYRKLSENWKREIKDPYKDPCVGQFELLSELKSYVYQEISDPYMTFIRTEFKTIFLPTLRLLTELCRSENKYTWKEVKDLLQYIMIALDIKVKWDECDLRLELYLKKVSDLLAIIVENQLDDTNWFSTIIGCLFNQEPEFIQSGL